MTNYSPIPGGTAVSRRSVLVGLTAIGCQSLVKPAIAQTPPTVHSFKLGDAEITIVSDGSMSMPLDWVLPGRPREEIAGVFESEGKKLGELSLQVNTTVIRRGRETILVDTGAGPDFAPQRGKLADNLATAGIKPEAVTLVVFTHAHPDHFWGVVDPLDGSSIFPSARHVMAVAERDYWLKSGVETGVADAVRGAALGTQRRLKELGAKIEAMNPGAEIASGLTATDTSGHSPGHVSLLLQVGSERLLIGGDVLVEPIISFARPAWPWGPDWDTERAIRSRLRTLDMLAADKTRLVGYHLPWPGLGRVERIAAATPSYRFIAG